MHANAVGNNIWRLGGIFVLALLVTLFASRVFAQTAVDAKACAEKKGDEAIAACTRVIDSGAKNRNMAGIYFNRGVEWTEKKDYDRAITDYTEAIKLNPKYREAFNNRGNAYRNKGDTNRALEDYESAIGIDPKWGINHRNRGNVLMAKRDYERALASFNEAIRLDSKDADASDSAAWLMATAPDAKLRDGKRAVVLAQKACELTQWKNASYVDTLAAAYAESGDYAEAVRRAQQALANPEFEQSEGKNAMRRLALYKAGKPTRLSAASANNKK